jgi:hypothetical protein
MGATAPEEGGAQAGHQTGRAESILTYWLKHSCAVSAGCDRLLLEPDGSAHESGASTSADAPCRRWFARYDLALVGVGGECGVSAAGRVG